MWQLKVSEGVKYLVMWCVSSGGVSGVSIAHHTKSLGRDYYY